MNWNGLEIPDNDSPEWYELGGALNIKSGAELERFDLGTFKLAGKDCPILTGYEVLDGRCRFCGKEIQKGKRKASYCRGHTHNDYMSCFRNYWRHFEWSSASAWALRRAEMKCQNCGAEEDGMNLEFHLEVHHIVPLKGAPRFFSAYNLPWNLIVLCHKCHLEVHAAIRGNHHDGQRDIFELAKTKGQSVMRLEVK